jgi:hypothetical protein
MNAARKIRGPSFCVDLSSRDLIEKIADRAIAVMQKHGGEPRGKLDIVMDITATHANGNPLRLADLLAADEFNLLHDVKGIERHLDRNTGKLGDCFSPRFSA